ncbi:hypothetical protein K0M31_018846 [Melipona bicolor]|uniref:Uncharacterized protein n=1 Tax=Melipona bicolor TaxID=60889 RepID=A0AA40KS31_9HYME|nr:hypothetical protein K0M31_018846 [Melipona bicolor]
MVIYRNKIITRFERPEGNQKLAQYGTYERNLSTVAFEDLRQIVVWKTEVNFARMARKSHSFTQQKSECFGIVVPFEFWPIRSDDKRRQSAKLETQLAAAGAGEFAAIIYCYCRGFARAQLPSSVCPGP